MPVKIFFCYAHEDEKLLNKLKAHLRPLQREGLIDVWHDHDISAGTEWEREISKHLNTAQIILLLVSPDFMNSEYCYSIEMQRALQRHERGEAKVIPVILRPVYWQGVLGKLQALPTDATPVMSSGWAYQDEAFYNVTEGITKVVEELTANLGAHSQVNEFQKRQDNLNVPETLKFSVQQSPPLLLSPKTIPNPLTRYKITPLMGKSMLLLVILGLLTHIFLSTWAPRWFATNTKSIPSISRFDNTHITIAPQSGNTPISLQKSPACPLMGTANAAVMSPLTRGNDPNIVYEVSSNNPIEPFVTLLKRYNAKSGSKSEVVKMQNVQITDAQISKDGQWILFITQESEQNKIQIVRMDGQHLQTLYCSPRTVNITDAQWSGDQKWVIFQLSSSQNPPILGGIYLLNITNGVLQPELLPSADCTTYNLVTWLDDTRVYMYTVPTAICADGAPVGGPIFCNSFTILLMILDINKGPNQHENMLQQVTDLPGCSSFDRSSDGRFLFISKYTDVSGPNSTGPSRISIQPAVGGNERVIYSTPNLAVIDVQVVSSTIMLLLIGNVVGDTSNNGLWKMQTNGSSLQRITPNTVRGGYLSLNQFSQYTWSNVSRDGSMYALQLTSYDTKYFGLLYGSMNGSTPMTFDSALNGTSLAIVGWTTM